MALLETIVLELTNLIAPKALDYFSKIEFDTNDFEKRIETHITFVANWCQIIQFYGMASYKDTADDTIGLQLSTIPRKFRGQYVEVDKMDEEAILTDPYNYVLLGDPGAGKTTTLKRLARRVLFDEPIEGVNKLENM